MIKFFRTLLAGIIICSLAVQVMFFVAVATPFFVLYALGKGGMKIIGGIISILLIFIIEVQERLLRAS